MQTETRFTVWTGLLAGWQAGPLAVSFAACHLLKIGAGNSSQAIEECWRTKVLTEVRSVFLSFIYLWPLSSSSAVVDDVDGGVPRALDIIQISKHKNEILTNAKHTHTQSSRAILDERQFPHEQLARRWFMRSLCSFVVIDIRTAIQCVYF